MGPSEEEQGFSEQIDDVSSGDTEYAEKTYGTGDYGVGEIASTDQGYGSAEYGNAAGLDINSYSSFGADESVNSSSAPKDPNMCSADGTGEDDESVNSSSNPPEPNMCSAGGTGEDDDDEYDESGRRRRDPQGRSRGAKPKNCPPGTVPIDESGLDKDAVHGIKDGIGAGPRDWVGVTPDGHIVTGDGQGNVEDHGPKENYLPRNNSGASEPDVPQSEDSTWETVTKAVLALGLSIAVVATVVAALADPEPASKLALAGLSVYEIEALGAALGFAATVSR